jgi:hypothetical protein
MTGAMVIIALIVTMVIAGGPHELLKALERVLRVIAAALQDGWVSFTR